MGAALLAPERCSEGQREDGDGERREKRCGSIDHGRGPFCARTSASPRGRSEARGRELVWGAHVRAPLRGVESLRRSRKTSASARAGAYRKGDATRGCSAKYAKTRGSGPAGVFMHTFCALRFCAGAGGVLGTQLGIAVNLRPSRATPPRRLLHADRGGLRCPATRACSALARGRSGRRRAPWSRTDSRSARQVHQQGTRVQASRSR